MPMKPSRWLAALAIATLALPAQAQRKAPEAAKKLYCWDENGSRVCSDALPADAVNRARDEFNASSGLRTAEVQRALSDEERAAAESEAEQRRVDAAAEETRRRTEQAMLLSYASEDDLRRVFAERTSIIDNNIETARYNVASLREGLVTLLQRAGERELSAKPVPPKAVADIRERHAELQRQLRLQASFERQRGELDTEIAQILVRYREIKAADMPATGTATQ